MKNKVIHDALWILILTIVFFKIEGCYAKFDMVMTSNFTTVEGIPVVETYMQDGFGKPMIIIQHGFKNNKESTLELAENLAEEGFFVVSPDAYAHGERTEDALPLAEIIVNTSKDYDVMIKAYEEDLRVDVNKLGITGFSMGGCITFHYATYGKYHPDAIAPTIATPYFEQLIGTKLGRSSFSASRGLSIEEDPIKIEKINEFILEHSPYEDYENLKDVAILMQNGELDRYVDSTGVRMLYEVLPRINANVQLILVPETKHQVSAPMKEEIVRFMGENVL